MGFGLHGAGFMAGVRLFLKALGCNVIAWLVYMLLVLFVYFVWIRDWQMNWGATPTEIYRPMAGDTLLVDPELDATRVVEVDAPPEDVWPWIVQIGYKRAGFYGFDKLDNGGEPSAKRILPEYQNLAVGDSIALGGPFLRVVELVENESLLLVFLKGAGPWEGATWSWGLYETDEGCTRLVSRLRQAYTFDSFHEVIGWSMIDAVEILLMRTTLRGIKYRVEELAAAPIRTRGGDVP